MGWNVGSELADEVWELFLKYNKYMPESSREKLAFELVDMFEDFDCDTMYECEFVEEYLEYNENSNTWEIK